MQSKEEKTKAGLSALVNSLIFEITCKKIHSELEELIESGILNSINLAELAVALEKKTGHPIPFIEIKKENFKTVHAICNLLTRIHPANH